MVPDHRAAEWLRGRAIVRGRRDAKGEETFGQLRREF